MTAGLESPEYAELEGGEQGRVTPLTNDEPKFGFSEHSVRICNEVSTRSNYNYCNADADGSLASKKLERLYKHFAPQQGLSKRELPRGTKRIPIMTVPDIDYLLSDDDGFDHRGDGPFLRNYGWAFTDAFALDYAKRHDLQLYLSLDPDLEALAGRSIIKFAELSDAFEEQNPELWPHICVMVRDVVLEHVESQMGFTLALGLPFSAEYPSMIALYSNYNIAKRHWVIERITRRPVRESITKLIKIMTPPGGKEPKPLWWYDRENDIVCALVHTPFLRLNGWHISWTLRTRSNGHPFAYLFTTMSRP